MSLLEVSPEALLQAGVAVGYGLAGLLLVGRRPPFGRYGIALALAACLAHLGLLLWRWVQIGQIPIVTRYEDLTVDALAVAAVYLVAQWREPAARAAGPFALLLACGGVAWALAYSRGVVPFSPSLRSNWLYVHAHLNSFALGAGALAAGFQAAWVAGWVQSPYASALSARYLAWAFFLWAAMVATGSWWANDAWGRHWGWDPIESWSLATVLAYAFFQHLRMKPAWRGRRWAAAALLPFAMMLFTTYGLLMLRPSLHSQYLFQ